MADSFAPNYALNSTDNAFSAVWKLTRCMKAAGWNVVAHSNGAAKTAAGTNGNDSWGNNANPLLDTYPAFDAAAAWIVLQGPTTVKLLLSGAPSGDFLRGEQVTQPATGATGEILGTVWDAPTASGWAVVLPRTGTFNGIGVVVGQISGYSFTPSSVKTFVREMVFFKNSANTTTGTNYYICADQTAESAQLFSVLATSAGATATIAPGAGGTGNGFPALGITNRGTGGAVTHTNWFGTISSAWQSHAMVGAVNASPSAGVSADGSFYLYIAYTSPVGAYTGFMFTRCDDSEPGDVDPYIFWWNNGNAVASWVRTSATSFSSSQNESWANVVSVSFASFKGYVARDCPVVSRDVATYYFGVYRNTSGAFFPIFNVGQPFPHSVQNHPNAVPPQPRDSFLLVTSSVRNTKGTTRWMQYASSGNYRDTLDGKKWLCVFPYGNALNPAVYIGPLDGSTTPNS
jgi:hypothetical protein